MKKGKRWMGNLLIVIGITAIIIVLMGMKTNQDHQDELIEAFAAVKTEAGKGTDNQENSITNYKAKADRIPAGMEGVLTIPSIELKAPVLDGATPEKLNEALGAISGLDRPGDLNGSYAIAGHQSHVFGKFFNRLNELEKGEVFQFETAEKILTFQVFDIQIVKPEEVHILKPQSGIALLSLVTCYPENSNEYRLIVQAKRIDKN